MLRLYAKLDSHATGEPEVLRLTSDFNRIAEFRESEALLIKHKAAALPSGFRRYLATAEADYGRDKPGICQLPSWMDYLDDGDVVRFSPATGDLTVLYRRASRFNSMLFTEQCNSNCIMCSQPPKMADDRHLVATYLKAIPLMDPATAELGITGGEPTLLGEQLFDLIYACKAHLPDTSLHMLSNGRMFNYLSLAQSLADVGHPDLVVGIPLYSDIACQHDFVVQAHGAFDQTIRGIMNLERCGIRIEIRVVLHRQTVGRLPQLARFITRNLPFVEHVALMGLEMMGFVRMNLDALWIDPVDYQPELASAVRILEQCHQRFSIYNHQLCTIPRGLWTHTRKSISDWKNEYIETCAPCEVQSECGGFFSSSSIRHSAHIHPVVNQQAAGAVLP